MNLAIKGANKVEWKRPRDGKEFVGFLAGGYQDTRKEIIAELWQRYGIRIVAHIGNEKRRDLNTFIPNHVEVVVLLADDLDGGLLQRVLRCARAIGAETIGIDRKKKPQFWDVTFNGNGYSSPPNWRDGVLIANVADPKRLEAERKAELAAIEETRPAWIDPALRPVKIADAVAVISQYIPEQPKQQQPPTPSPPQDDVKKLTPWAKALIEEREKLGISQVDASRRCNMNQTMMSSYERGVSIPQYGYYQMLLTLFPNLPPPPNMRGQISYEKHGGVVRHGGGVDKVGPPGSALTTKKLKTAAQAFNGKPEAAPAPSPPAPVAEKPAPAQMTITQPLAPPVNLASPYLAAPRTQEELLTINLRSGGTITLTASVNLLKLRGDDRVFVFEIIDRLQAYEDAKK
jgi:hypothetical protein